MSVPRERSESLWNVDAFCDVGANIEYICKYQRNTHAECIICTHCVALSVVVVLVVVVVVVVFVLLCRGGLTASASVVVCHACESQSNLNQLDATTPPNAHA